MNLRQRIFNYFSTNHFLMGASLLRLLFGINVLWFYISNFMQREYLWGPNGVLPNSISSLALSQTNQFSLYNFSSSEIYFEVLYFLGIIITILYILGFFPRFFNILMYLFTYSLYNKNFLLLDGGNNILIVVLFYMMFLQTGAYLGVHAQKIRKKLATARETSTFSALIQNAAAITVMLQVCLMYFISFLYKAQGHEWYNGTALYYILRVNEFILPGVNPLIYHNPLLVTFLTYSTMIFQASFPFLVWNKRMKPLMLVGAVCLHLGIALIMGLAWFSLTMLSVDVIFLDDTTYLALASRFNTFRAYISTIFERWLERMRTSPGVQGQKLLVLYDDACPICIKSVNTWKGLDMLHLLDFQSLWDFPLENELITREQLQTRIHSRKLADEAYTNGCNSLVQIMVRIPLLVPIAGFLWLLSKVGAGQVIYDIIAKRRYVLRAGQCTTDSCAHQTTALGK